MPEIRRRIAWYSQIFTQGALGTPAPWDGPVVLDIFRAAIRKHFGTQGQHWPAARKAGGDRVLYDLSGKQTSAFTIALPSHLSAVAIWRASRAR